jgi:hypothetical protein
MKSTFLKQFISFAILLFSMQICFGQQKLRPSERPYQQEFAKAKKMQEQRNALVKRMGNRNDMAQRQNANRPVSTSNQNNSIVVPRQPINQRPLPNKSTSH